ncbi:hypothetical protein ATCC90586_011262 [Pythium insidiosum]|nr:hypothetical protein ATCC90586_011262 [Pythium insidiosum]
MAQLSGRAKAWAFGCRVSDRDTFPDLETFTSVLQQTFEAPQSEFRLRAESLSVKQGNTDLHDYIQKVRYLALCVVGSSIDMTTQVTTFMTGLRDGLMKTQLFREYLETLGVAFAVALREDFNRANIPSPKVVDKALRYVTEVASVKKHSGASAVQDAGSKSGSTRQDVGIKSESQARNTDSNGVCHEDLQAVFVSGEAHATTIRVEKPPSRAEELLQLPVQSWESMLKDLENEEVEPLCLVTELAAHSSTEDPDVAAKTQRELR